MVDIHKRWSLVPVVALICLSAGFGFPNDLKAQSEPPKQSSVSFAQYQANMDGTYSKFDQMLAGLDRARFELDPALESLDYDARTIIEFVTGEIGFQQYPGVLRGAKGTLMSRAGNALDQSLLLATLLRNAGYEARIAEGELSEEQVFELFGTISVLQQRGFSEAESIALSEAARSLDRARDNPSLIENFINGLQDSNPRKDLEPIRQLSEKNTRIINDILSTERGLELQPVPQSILAEAQQYFWVEFSEGPGNPWQSIHPVFQVVPESFNTLAAVNYLANSVPEEYQQRITISVEIEQSIGDELKSHTVMSPWSRPVASLYGMELVFYNIPLNYTGSDSPISQDEALATAEFFMPVFSAAPAQSLQPFDLNGNTAPSDAVMDPASGIFKQVGDSFGLASAGLNAMDSTDGATIADFIPKLVSQTIRIEFQAPGQEPRVFEKPMIETDLVTFDENGEPTMALKDALSGQLTIALGLGDIPDQFILSETVLRLKNSRPLLDAVHAQILDTDEDELWDKNKFSGVPTNWGRMSTLISLMNEGDLPTDHVAYFAEPALIIHRFERDKRRDIEGSLDILSNQRRVFDVSDDTPKMAPMAQVALGVWDTAIEEIFYPRASSDFSGKSDLQRSAEYARIASPAQLEAFSDTLQPESTHLMQRDLEAGFTLLVSNKLPFPGEPEIAWWRIDEETGETLGMLADGTGGATDIIPVSVTIPEWLAKLVISFAVSGAFAYGGYVDCVNATQEERCCAEMAVGGTVVGGVIGFGIGMQVLWEFTLWQLFWVEMGVNGAVGLYTSMDMFSELCTTTIFGKREAPLEFLMNTEQLFAYRAPDCNFP